MALPLRDWLWRAPRISCALPARLRRGEAPLEATLVNLSLTGAFLESEAPPAVGERLSLLLSSGAELELELAGKVVRHGSARKPLARDGVDDLVVLVPGLGMEFDELDDAPAEKLQDFLDALLER